MEKINKFDPPLYREKTPSNSPTGKPRIHSKEFGDDPPPQNVVRGHRKGDVVPQGTNPLLRAESAPNLLREVVSMPTTAPTKRPTDGLSILMQSLGVTPKYLEALQEDDGWTLLQDLIKVPLAGEHLMSDEDLRSTLKGLDRDALQTLVVFLLRYQKCHAACVVLFGCKGSERAEALSTFLIADATFGEVSADILKNHPDDRKQLKRCIHRTARLLIANEGQLIGTSKEGEPYNRLDMLLKACDRHRREAIFAGLVLSQTYRPEDTAGLLVKYKKAEGIKIRLQRVFKMAMLTVKLTENSDEQKTRLMSAAQVGVLLEGVTSSTTFGIKKKYNPRDAVLDACKALQKKNRLSPEEAAAIEGVFVAAREKGLAPIVDESMKML